MELEQLLVRQAGVVSRGQALRCGVSPRTVARRRSSGAWTEILPGVYLVAGHRRTSEVRVRAAWLWAGARCTVHGPAAAFWHGMLAEVPPCVAVTVPRSLRRASREEVLVRHKDLAAEDRTLVRGVAVTAAGLTVLETATVLERGPAFLDRALQRHLRPEELGAAYARALGGYGMDRAGRLLVAAMDRADSVAERRLLRLLRAAGVAGIVRGFPFGAWQIDIAVPSRFLAIEIDGWAWHVDADRFRTDRRKQNALVSAGWTVLRFTWADIQDRPGRTIAVVRGALRT